MKILISGSSGLVGTALVESLESGGHDVSRLVRHAPSSANEIEWSPDRYSIALARIEGFDAVVHLAGESIAEGRWNDEKKARIRDSRVKSTQLLSESFAQLAQPPKVFVSASAIGYYGNRGDERLTESSGPGDNFLAGVGIEWEKATEKAVEKGIRVANLRFGVILAANGGALAKMLPPFRMGIGGRIGDGKQWMSWIALDDVVSIIEFVIANESLSGPINVVAPNPVRNAEFTSALGKALSRPTFVPVPAFGARLAFGEMADALLLSSQRVEPERLKEAGYKFQFPELRAALKKVLSE